MKRFDERYVNKKVMKRFSLVEETKIVGNWDTLDFIVNTMYTAATDILQENKISNSCIMLLCINPVAHYMKHQSSLLSQREEPFQIVSCKSA